MILVVILGILLFSFLVFKWFEHRKIYIPERDYISTPHDVGLGFDEIKFPSRDKVILYGWFVPGSKESVILFCQGNRGNISHRIESIEILHHLGYSLFIFDYRGYGKSNGFPTERGLYQDALGAYDFLRERGYDVDNIILYGCSLGGAVAIYLATVVEAKGLIIESSFESIYDLSYDILKYHIPEWLISNRFSSIERIGNINIRKLIIHSEDDDLIPFFHGTGLYEAALQPKKMLKIKGSHDTGFLDSGYIYEEGLRDFLEGL